MLWLSTACDGRHSVSESCTYCMTGTCHADAQPETGLWMAITLLGHQPTDAGKINSLRLQQQRPHPADTANSTSGPGSVGHFPEPKTARAWPKQWKRAGEQWKGTCKLSEAYVEDGLVEGVSRHQLAELRAPQFRVV